LSGAENVAAEIINMTKEDIEMVYVSPDGDIKLSLKNRNIPFIPLSEYNVKSVKKIIAQWKPDLIHAHDVRASIYSAKATKKIPIVSHLHCNFKNMNALSLKAIIYRMYLRFFSHVIVVSKSTLSEYVFSKSLTKKSSVINNVIDKNRIIMNVDKDDKSYNYDVIFVGRITDQKDPIRFVRIASQVCRKIPHVKFGIIGDGKLRVDMEKNIENLGIKGNIEFCGYLENPYKVISDAKVLLMCSKYEGLPITALEAMLLGTPIVSTPVDGLKNIITNGLNGYFETSDELLTQRVYELLTNNELHREVSIAAQDKAKRLNNLNDYKREIVNVYNTALFGSENSSDFKKEITNTFG
jgi:glycosyltransferase involved in cell wall biosynthesis